MSAQAIMVITYAVVKIVKYTLGSENWVSDYRGAENRVYTIPIKPFSSRLEVTGWKFENSLEIIHWLRGRAIIDIWDSFDESIITAAKQFRRVSCHPIELRDTLETTPDCIDSCKWFATTWQGKDSNFLNERFFVKECIIHPG